MIEEFTLTEKQIKMLKNVISKRQFLFLGMLLGTPLFILNILGVLAERKAPIFLMINTGLFTAILFFVLIFVLYKKKVIPLQKDITEKSGIYISKQIIRKTCFEHVGRFFIFFKDPKIPNKEVTLEEYNYYNEGDYCKIPFSKYGGIVLDGFMNYDLM